MKEDSAPTRRFSASTSLAALGLKLRRLDLFQADQGDGPRPAEGRQALARREALRRLHRHPRRLAWP